MKYTKNLGIKLMNQGYKLCDSWNEPQEKYETFRKGLIEVTADHTKKQVVVELRNTPTVNDCIKVKGVSTLNELEALNRLINGVDRKKTTEEDGN